MEKFIIFCTCVRPSTNTTLTIPLPPEVTADTTSTNTTLTIPLPPEVTADTMVDYIGNEFDWQFMPMSVQVVPAIDDMQQM